MPYTLAHPGFSLWIKRKWFKKLSYSGLIFGSLTPDFDLLFQFSNPRFHIINFNFFDIFLILLPLTLFISLIFHFYTRNTLINNLPKILQSQLQKYKSFDYLTFLKKNFILEIFSILVGISLHLSIDFLSHWNAYFFMLGVNNYIYPSKYLSDFYYYFGWYFPQILATIFGFYFLMKLMEDHSISIGSLFNSIRILRGSEIKFWFNFFVVSVAFGVLKFLFFTYEGDGLAWHVLIIFYTSGLIFSFFATPFIFNMLSKIKDYKNQ